MSLTEKVIVQKIDILLLLSFSSAWKSKNLATIREGEYTHLLSGDLAAHHADEFLNYYLDMENLTCCDIRAGLEIEIEGKSWTEYCCDHIGLVTHWFFALENILKGGNICETTTWVWDQSYLVFQRNGDSLTLFDEHICTFYKQRGEEHFAWSPITVNLWSFAAQLTEVGEIYNDLIDNLIKEVESRGFIRQELLDKLEGKGDKPTARGNDIELKLAIIMRELLRSLGLRERIEEIKSLMPSKLV